MQTVLLLIFFIVYAAIIFERPLRIDKAASALCGGVLCWAIYIMAHSADSETVLGHLGEGLSEISGILFFLIGAMTIVEIIDQHNGFRFVTDRIRTQDKRRLMWVLGLTCFFLSAVLDNLTTTIVMVSLLPKLMASRRDRLLFASVIVVAANAGGAWTPIGDVTTTMLWIGKQVSAGAVIKYLFLPSLVSLVVPLALLSLFAKGEVVPPCESEKRAYHQLPRSLQTSMFFVGIILLLLVPVFKTITHLPPYMGMLLAMGSFWVYTEVLYRRRGYAFKSRFSVVHALRNVNMTTIFFFFGILMCIGALQASGVLSGFAGWLSEHIRHQGLLVTLIGMLSSVVDNVPLVAAAQAMYTYPTDDFFWLFLSYAAGTGGSLLIIGSAAGVAAMGIERIDFLWYLRKVTPCVLVGYLAGAAVFALVFHIL